MTFFGLTITRTKAVPSGLSSVSGRGGWWPIVREPFTGAWQRNIEIRTEDVLSYAPVWACVTLIASDISKLRLMLVEKDAQGIWTETENPAFSPFLTKPNRYQNRIQFMVSWIISKYVHGNTYILKVRDNRGGDSRGNVVAGYVLDPTRVKPLVSPDGSVFYELNVDHLSNVPEAAIVPASEIMHDVLYPLYHPLIGVSPIMACGLAALQGLKVQNHSTLFFGNGARPGGILTAPGNISDETARRLEQLWAENYGGQNAGKVAVIGDGLKYEQMTMSAVDAQLIEQLKWTAEDVCTAFHVPPFMIGVAPPPPYNNVEALNQQYYSQCLQHPIESAELLLDEGLGLLRKGERQTLGTEFDLDGLLRMDTATRVKAAADAIGSGGMSPNEARLRYFDLGPVTGGDSPYLQQQNFSLAALAKRDAEPDPFATAATPIPALPAARSDEANEMDDADAEKHVADLFRKDLGLIAA